MLCCLFIYLFIITFCIQFNVNINKIKATPHGWKQGDDVVVSPKVSTEDAKKMYPKINVIKPYLRIIPQPDKK